jgi:hypothetical protein
MSGDAEISPMRLVHRIVWGLVLEMGSSVPLVFAGHHRLGGYLATRYRISILCGALALLVSGNVMSYLAERRIKRGMDAGRWSDVEWEPTRSWLSGRAPGVILFLTLLCVTVVFWALRWNAIGFLPALIFPFGTVGRVRNVVQEPQPGVAPVNRKELKPLRSESWGLIAPIHP